MAAPITGAATRAAHALFGAYVADAAALGTHWLYDADRMAALSPLAFRDPDPAPYEGVSGVFVHAGKRAGALSHYGAQLRVTAQSLAACGGWDGADHAARFTAAFGPGGWWTGYADKATKKLLANIAADVAPHGADDDQIPGLSRLVAPAVAGLHDVGALLDATANHADARAYAPAAMTALLATIDGAAPADAAAAGAAAAHGQARAALEAAITNDADPATFGGEVGRACPLRQSMPVVFHILGRAPDFRTAVQENIRVAGDTCGRATLIGAVFAAAGGVGPAGVALDWALRLTDGAALWDEAQALAALRKGDAA